MKNQIPKFDLMQLIRSVVITHNAIASILIRKNKPINVTKTFDLKFNLSIIFSTEQRYLEIDVNLCCLLLIHFIVWHGNVNAHWNIKFFFSFISVTYSLFIFLTYWIKGIEVNLNVYWYNRYGFCDLSKTSLQMQSFFSISFYRWCCCCFVFIFRLKC